jgi:hypothetical protein
VIVNDFNMPQVTEDGYSSAITELGEDSGYSEGSEPSTPPTSPMPVTPNLVDVVFVFYPIYSNYQQQPVEETEPAIIETNYPTPNKRRLIKWNLPPPVMPPTPLPGWEPMP